MAQPIIHSVDTQTMLTFIQEKRAATNTPGLTWHERILTTQTNFNQQSQIMEILLMKHIPTVHDYYESGDEASFFARITTGAGGKNQFKLGGAPDDNLRSVLYAPTQIVSLVLPAQTIVIYTFPNPGITEYLFGQLQEKLPAEPQVGSWNILPDQYADKY